MNYESYQHARDAAWRILIDCQVTDLPIKISAICKQLGICVFSYQDGAQLIAHYQLTEHASHTDGFAIYFDHPMIFYNGKNTPERCRFTIAHELGHIILEHISIGQVTRINRDPQAGDDPRETAANQFAARILAPACVLWGLQLHTPDQIAKACNISLQAATFRAARMEILYGRNRFLTSPLEREVFAQFENYVAAHKSDSSFP